MDEKTVTALLKTKQEMGTDFLQNTQRVRAFLSDFLPAQPGERRYAERQMLVSLLEAGLPQQLNARHPWSDAELAALAQRTAAALLLDAHATHQGVRVWHFVTRVGVEDMPLDAQFIFGSTAQSPAPPKSVAQQHPRQGAQNTALSKDLLKAVRLGDATQVRHLLAAGADANAKGSETALIIAAAGGHAEIVRLLLAAGADANAKDYYGRTALIRVTENGNMEIVNHLLAAGVDVNAKDKKGRTAIMIASRFGYFHIRNMLYNAGAKLKQKVKRVPLSSLEQASKLPWWTRHLDGK